MTNTRESGWAEGFFKLILVLLTAYHISLLGQGALAFGDEGLYTRHSQAAAEALLRGSFREAAEAISGWGARPGEYLLRMPSAMLQLLVERKAGVPILNPDSLRIATAQNVVVSLGLLLAFWRVSLILLPGREIAAVASIAFALLTSNQMWVRHLIPYDAALLAHLVALTLCLRGCEPLPPTSTRWKRSGLTALILGACLLAYPIAFYRDRSLGLTLAVLLLAASLSLVGALWSDWGAPEANQILKAGFGSGIALSIYPAYYSFTMACGLILLASGKRERAIAVTPGSVRRCALFGASAFFVMFGFETFARLGGISYLGGARLLSGTITLGSFEEGFVFLPKYLLAVDGPGGLAVVLLAAIGLFAVVRQRTGTDPGQARVLVAFLALYLIYGFQSTVMHRMVFTGRYARMYIPVIIWLAAAGLWSLGDRARRIGTMGWLACSLAGFASFAIEYRSVAYPADVLYQLGIGYEDLVPENIRHEFEPLARYNLPVKAVTAGAMYVTRPDDRRFIIWNFALPKEIKGVVEASAGSDYALFYDALHFSSARAVGWEGFTEPMRYALLRPGFRLRVFRQIPRTTP